MCYMLKRKTKTAASHTLVKAFPDTANSLTA